MLPALAAGLLVCVLVAVGAAAWLGRTILGGSPRRTAADAPPRPPELGDARERFIAANTPPRLPEPGALGGRRWMLFYNVHSFTDARGDASAAAIGQLIQKYSEIVDLVVLAEVPKSSDVRGLLRPAGYKYVATAPNGLADDGLMLVAAAKEPVAHFVINADPPPPRTYSGVAVNRKQLSVQVGHAHVVAVHLEIGVRAPVGPRAQDGARRDTNSRMRIGQLAKIVEHSPAAIVGDFNFTLGDPECAYLRSRGYAPANGGSPESTPFNRVDHCFLRVGRAPGANLLLPCGYSDHLPMLQELSFAGSPELNFRQLGSSNGVANSEL